VTIGCLTLETSARQLFVEGHPLDLTTTEYDLLACLVRSAGRIVSRDELMATVFGRDATPIDRSLDVHVCHLRQKLGPLRELILTVRSIGYMCRLEQPRSQP
jgi:DNA-binding response OmpR family regulator